MKFEKKPECIGGNLEVEFILDICNLQNIRAKTSTMNH